ncbi:MAG: hypothetical protein GAK32_01012 [Pseudomonas fluorescens]|nr:MAG: hypothetical protein GAK32_01012 [Pseudomonas fluorescens]
MILAGVLLVGALIAGYWGVMLTQPPAPVATTTPVLATSQQAEVIAEDTTRQPVVVLAHDVPPFVPLTAADLVVERLRTVPAGSFTQVDQAIGRAPWRPLSAGAWLDENSFSSGSALARMIRADERALAVSVDEVTSAGGQLSPGDYVDALLYLRQDTLNEEPSAQVVVPAMRVLAVGDVLGLTNDGKPASPPATTPEAIAQQAQRRAAARTAVLAVPEPLLSQLMLATSAGTLRLAVRSADEQLLSHYWAGESDSPAKVQNANRELYQFAQLALHGPQKRPAPGPGTGSPRTTSIEVIRGNQSTQPAPQQTP